jgi:hypothetical protein
LTNGVGLIKSSHIAHTPDFRLSSFSFGNFIEHNHYITHKKVGSNNSIVFH